jgi:hypothetical protein
MPKNLKKGAIIIPLIILMLLSFGVLSLAKFISSSQSNVEAAIDSRFDDSSISLSSKIDKADNWIAYSDSAYKYKLYYPKQWVGNRSFENGTDFLQTYERFLSTKINLKITVAKSFDITPDAQYTKFGNNTFDLYNDDENLKSAVAKVNNLYYNLDLKQDAYFASPLEFKSFFFQVLKKFEFLN